MMYVRGVFLVYEELKVYLYIVYYFVFDSSYCNLIFIKIYVMVDEGIKVNISIIFKFGGFFIVIKY